MANQYYNYSGNFIPGTLARAESVSAEFSSVATGFSKLSIQGVDTGLANAYVVTTTGYPVAAYQDGNNVQFEAIHTNTGPSTINVNGLGPVPLLRFNGNALVSGDVVAGAWYTCIYTVLYSGFVIVSPTAYATFAGTISLAPPTNKVGLTASGGASTAAAPIDATWAIDQAIIPTWTGLHTFNGKVVVGAPASGVALTVTGVAGSSAAQFLTTGVQVGTPTGGDKGAGAINVSGGFYINNVSVTAGTTVSSISGTANQITASAATGAVTLSLPTTIIVSAAGASLTLADATHTGTISAGNTLMQGDGTSGYVRTQNAGTLFLGANATNFWQISSAGNLSNGTVPTSGVALTVTGAGSGQSTVTIADTANTNGANLLLTGNGVTTPSKFLRVQAGVFQVLNSGYTAALLSITDAGNTTIPAPSSGIALSVSGLTTNVGVLVTTSGNGTAFQANGPAATQLSALTLAQTGQTAWALYQPGSSNDLRFFAGADRIVFTAAGNVTINVPSSGVALTVNGATGSQAMLVSAASGQQAIVATAGADLAGILINGAQNNISLTINNTQAGATANWRITSAATGSGFPAGSLVIGSASSNFLQIATTGAVTVAAPSSGVALTVTGVAGASAAQFLTTGVQVGSPTGGDKGAGTINVAGNFYINGTAISTGGVTSITGTANQIAASASTGAVTLSIPGVIALTSASTVNSSVSFSPNGGGTVSKIGGSGAASGIVTGDAVGDLGIASAGAINFACNGTTTNQFSMTDTGGMFASGVSALGRGQINATQVSVVGVPLYRAGTFTGTVTGMTAGLTPTISYVISGNTATISIPSGSTGTSNSTSMTITGVPAVLQPAVINSFCACVVQDNGNNVIGGVQAIAGSGTWTFHRDILATGALSTTGFTATGTKGFSGGVSFTYTLI